MSDKGWELIDCGCCAGLAWGTEEPTECSRCTGNGILWRHIESGVLAEYPGGKFRGHDKKRQGVLIHE